MLTATRKIGRFGLTKELRLGRMGVFLGKSFFYLLMPPLKLKLLLKQIDFVGYQSLPIIFLTGAFTGMVLAFQGFLSLSRVGSEAFLGPLVGVALITEMGPVISALMVTGRAGSSITAEIGIMRNSEQIDAIKLMGLNPYRYLVVPNLLAMILCLPLLAAIFDVVGIYGGYLIGGKLLGLSSGTYFGEMAAQVDYKDILNGLFKSLNFGVIIAWICCFKGYYTGIFTGQGAKGVSQSTTQAVVMACVLILVWDYFLTSIRLFS